MGASCLRLGKYIMSYIIGSSGAKEDKQTIIHCSHSKEQLLYDPKIRDPWSIGQALDVLKKEQPQTRIGFTNGTFKVLTPAHAVFLARCKTRCNLLIVGLNSDYSLRLLNKNSPFSDKERAFLLAQQEAVNYISFFDEENPAALIYKLNPDIVFKGYDYKNKDVISAGKPVEIIEHPFDLHTSDIFTNQKSSGFKFFEVPQ